MQLILGLIWTLSACNVLCPAAITLLVLHYDVHGHRSAKQRKMFGAAGASAKAEMLAWVQSVVSCCAPTYPF